MLQMLLQEQAQAEAMIWPKLPKIELEPKNEPTMLVLLYLFFTRRRQPFTNGAKTRERSNLSKKNHALGVSFEFPQP